MPQTDVLIVGAGPTGLTLACWLKKLGVGFKLIDKAAGPGTASRALAVHARTLEFHDMLGIANEAVARGRKFEAVNYWVKGRRAARAFLGDVGRGLSRFPFILILPQDAHEKLLTEHLEAQGGAVDWRTELTTLSQDAQSVRAVLKTPDGAVETWDARYLCGCDGASSAVRHVLRVGFPGGSYSETFFVADAAADGAAVDGELHVGFEEKEFAAIFPLREPNRARFVGLVPESAREKETTFEDVRALVEGLFGVGVSQVNWFSTYRVHHRVAEHFRAERAFLLGDAGHIHSPAGGQGMNTGIGDAVNLAWKLAEVVQGQAAESLLDSYETERIGFARSLVRTTDRAFSFAVDRSWITRFALFEAVPRLLPLLTKRDLVRRRIFKQISQTAIEYRSSPLSVGAGGRVRAGDRLPWAEFGQGESNYDSLRRTTWQAHVYGEPEPDLMETSGIETIRFPWTEAFATTGFERGGVYLIRPDGHVGYAGDAAGLRKYLNSYRPSY